MNRSGRTALGTICGVLLGACLAAPVSAQGHDAATVNRSNAAAQARHLVRDAVAYEHGEGVPRDAVRAAAMYCEAARLGNAEGMYSLGWMYANGRGVVRSDAHAATLFAMAAYLGHEHAARMRRYTGDYLGEVPDCLLPPRQRQYAGPWDVDSFLARLGAERRQVARLVAELAPEHGVHPRLALAVALTESALDPRARSPRNAMGVMQLIPATAERFAVRQPWDPEQNIRGGLRYLRWLLAYFRGDVTLAVAAYNAGEGAVDRHRGVPPYRETRQYVDRVLGLAQQRTHPYDAALAEPSPIVSPTPATRPSGES
ncbi:transglycosylase SLT domain-containing protein [Pseudothauera rhizosphaerae]|uniref:Lytic transglycosylase n=1 Tax=Pseudothauera rhizosphaerae TaxID=2565932 RepID=A0A4S4ALU3_9RHOO|nr:transglycosylase SLT domain-containing protein [Pseudothauera rhizosphaerae]THF60507.1 lytic transglycosylase [Pseudothauera rhizosphaerae]